MGKRKLDFGATYWSGTVGLTCQEWYLHNTCHVFGITVGSEHELKCTLLRRTCCNENVCWKMVSWTNEFDGVGATGCYAT
jgi:hypothetical protein